MGFDVQHGVKILCLSLKIDVAFRVCFRADPLRPPRFRYRIISQSLIPRLIEFIDSRVIMCLPFSFTWEKKPFPTSIDHLLLDKGAITRALQTKLPCLRPLARLLKASPSHLLISDIY